jgi:hypothetical protein
MKINKTLPKVNAHPLGKNSPNLVTLAGIIFMIQFHKNQPCFFRNFECLSIKAL